MVVASLTNVIGDVYLCKKRNTAQNAVLRFLLLIGAYVALLRTDKT